MRRFFTQQIWLLTLLLLGTSQASQAAVSQFDQSEINGDRFLTVAAPAGRSGYQLLILEQVKDSRPCWNESGNNPTIVEPLLLQFDFTGICGRSTDSNGYSLRTAGEDQGLRYSLRVMKQQNDLVLVAASNTVRNLEIPIGRSNGLPAPGEFVQIKLDPGWRLTRRTFNGRTTGHVYLTNDQPISYLVALASSPSGTVPPGLSQPIPTPDGAVSPSQLPGTAQPNSVTPIPVPLPGSSQSESPTQPVPPRTNSPRDTTTGIPIPVPLPGSSQSENPTQPVPPQISSPEGTTTGIPIPVPLPNSPQSGSSVTRPATPTAPRPNSASNSVSIGAGSSPQSAPSTTGTSLPLPRQSNTTPPPPPPPPTTPSDRPVAPLNSTPATGSPSRPAPSASSSPGRTLPALPSPSAPANPSNPSSNSSTSSPTIVPTVPTAGNPATGSPATSSTSQPTPSANSSSGRTLPALPPRQSTSANPSSNSATNSGTSSSTNSATIVPTVPAPTSSSTTSTPTTTVPTLPAAPSSAPSTETAAAPSQTNSRNSGYRVLVEANTAELQDQVRSVVPQAQIVTLNGQVVMQAGLFRDLSSAEQLRQKLIQSNLSATVVPIR